MPRRMIFLAVISLAIHFVSSSTTLIYGQPTEGTKTSPAAPAVEDFIEGNYWALIIGINKYPTMNQDKQLDAARKDAEAVAKLLKERYGFSGKRIIELYDEAATRRGIIRALSALNRRLTDKDSLFIYFAGHGEFEVLDKDLPVSQRRYGMGYWIPTDAELDDASSYVFNDYLRDCFASLKAKHIYMVVDSAFLGSLYEKTDLSKLNRATVIESYQKKSRWVLSSGGLYPVPDVADKNKNGHSVFAWHFMKTMEKNTRPYLLAKDIAEPVAIRVSNEVPDQLPRSAPVVGAGDEGGQFVFRLRKEFISLIIEDRGCSTCIDDRDLLPLPNMLYKIHPEEFDKKKQAMIERLKQLAEEKKRQETEEEKRPAAAWKEAEERMQQEAKEREARLAALAREAEDQKRKLAEAFKKGNEPIVEATLRPFQAPRAKDPAPVVTIPVGEFVRGSKAGDGQPDESPQRTVYVDAYTIDKHEVTVKQYAAYLKKSGAEPPDYWDRVNQKEDGNRPVVGVDWLDAKDYCEYYGKQLPTEAQWEKAARGIDGRKYPWGNDDPGPLFANFASGLSFSYSKSLSNVGSYEDGKSPYGVYDMIGNVWEWVNDWYSKDYYRVSSPKNPAGPEDGDYVVIRGGSWSKKSAAASVASRKHLSPSVRSNSVGFRCTGEAQ